MNRECSHNDSQHSRVDQVNAGSTDLDRCYDEAAIPPEGRPVPILQYLTCGPIIFTRTRPHHAGFGRTR